MPARRPYDLAAIVDPGGVGTGGTGDIDGGEAAAAIEKAMVPGSVGVLPHDLATSVDPVGRGGGSSGDIDGGEATGGVEEAMPARRPYDLAAIVDPVGR